MYILVTRFKVTRVKVTRIKVREASSLQCFLTLFKRGPSHQETLREKSVFWSNGRLPSKTFVVLQQRQRLHQGSLWHFATASSLPAPFCGRFYFLSWKNYENELTSHNIWLKIYVHIIHILPWNFFFKFSSDSFLSMFNSRFLICST